MKSMLALMAGTMMFAACSNDDITENVNEQKTSELKPMTFTASMEGEDGATRAAIDGLDINWEETDMISIFDGATENNGDQLFTLTAGKGTTSGTFKGEAANADTYYALYPYAESKIESKTVTEAEAMAAAGRASYKVRDWKRDWEEYSRYPDMLEDEMNMYGISPENQAIIFAYLKDEGIETKSGPQFNAGSIEDVVLPAVQTATAGSADPQAMLMIGASTDATTLEFKNVCAYVKVTPQFDCTRIVLKSNDTESLLAGTMTLGLDTDGNPTTTVTANGTNEVTLSGDIKANNTYYIAVRPETLADGFTIKFTTTDNRYNKSTNNEVTLTRSKVLNLGSFETSKLNPIPTTGTATRKGDIEVNWVQLWENSPKWAEYNVGAANNKAEDYGDLANWSEDFVSSRWGTAWRLPTSDELDKFSSQCKIEWIEGYKGTEVNGLLVTGQEGTDFEFNSIFLPAHKEIWGEYWSSSCYVDGYPCELYIEGAWCQIDQDPAGNTFPARAVLAE